MDEYIKQIIRLIKSALTSVPFTVPDSFDWHTTYSVGIAHHIAPLLFYGLRLSKCVIPEDYLRLFKSNIILAAVQDEMQTQEIGRIQGAFESQNIEFMLLKGLNLKQLYPDPALRTMSDLDILILKRQYKAVKNVIETLGYSSAAVYKHVYVWEKSGVILELHTSLNPPSNDNPFLQYGDGWNLAIPCEPDSHQFRLSNEDQFIFLFTHFTKHYKNGGGIGIRHIVDLWVYQNAYPDMDFSYIQTELAKLHLFEFYKNIRDVLDVWFGERASDERTDFITNRIFESGSYGTEKSKAVAFVVKSSPGNSSAVTKRNKEIIRRIFLPFNQMISRFPVVRRLPFLLPFFWLVRILDAIFDRGKLSKQKEILANITPEKIEQYKKELEFVGLK